VSTHDEPDPTVTTTPSSLKTNGTSVAVPGSTVDWMKPSPLAPAKRPVPPVTV
jgi:hypothetical protein